MKEHEFWSTLATKSRAVGSMQKTSLREKALRPSRFILDMTPEEGFDPKHCEGDTFSVVSVEYVFNATMATHARKTRPEWIGEVP